MGPANDASGVATVAETLAVFRILRALKMVHALQQGCTNTPDYGHWWPGIYDEDLNLNPS